MLCDICPRLLAFLSQRYGCSVVFSTATQPALNLVGQQEFLGYTSGWQPTEIVKNVDEMFMKSRRISVEWPITGETSSFEKIANCISEEKQVCVIVNLKKHANRLFNLLEDTGQENLYHISTSMCSAHRSATLTEVNILLQSERPCTLISTQCIEAGVDLDFPVLFRALAPLEAIIQAAGRCNRNKRFNTGRFIVFEPDTGNNPYPEKTYQKAAELVKYLLTKGEIDICSPQIVNEYYRLLYSNDNMRVSDELKHSLRILDFEQTENNYRLINTQSINILVPYERPLFDQLSNYALSVGIDRYFMQKARPITVSVFMNRNSSLRDICEPVYFKGKRKDGIDSGWYILRDISAYSEKTGLMLNKDQGDLII